MCNPGAATSCTISTESLVTYRGASTTANYGLSPGDLVRVKGQAINAIGNGVHSGENTYAVSLPAALSRPDLRLSYMTHEAVEIEWTDVL